MDFILREVVDIGQISKLYQYCSRRLWFDKIDVLETSTDSVDAMNQAFVEVRAEADLDAAETAWVAAEEALAEVS